MLVLVLGPEGGPSGYITTRELSFSLFSVFTISKKHLQLAAAIFCMAFWLRSISVRTAVPGL